MARRVRNEDRAPLRRRQPRQEGRPRRRRRRLRAQLPRSPWARAAATTKGIEKQADAMRRNRDARDRREREAAQALAAQFEGKTVEVKARAGAEGKLFGSVTASDIAAAIQAQTGARARPSQDRARRSAEGTGRGRRRGAACTPTSLPLSTSRLSPNRALTCGLARSARRPQRCPQPFSTACGERLGRAHPREWRTHPPQSPGMWKTGPVIHTQDTGFRLYLPTGTWRDAHMPVRGGVGGSVGPVARSIATRGGAPSQ